MWLTEEKIAASVSELEKRRYQVVQTLFPFLVRDCTDMTGNHHAVPPRGLAREADVGLAGQDFTFKGRDRYLSLEKRLKLPTPPDGCELAGLFDFGRTGSGYNSGFESLLYINGEPYQGVDSHHREAYLSAFAGQNVDMGFILWSGLEGGGPPVEQRHDFRRADLAWLHRDANRLYYYIKAISKALTYLSGDQPEKQWLIQMANQALLTLDWDKERFYQTASQAVEELEEALRRHPNRSPITIHCVGHTHIDVAWLWRLRHTREKAVRSFSTVLRLMEENEDFVFLQTQPQLYAFIKEDMPELYKRIQEKVRQGRWEVDGCMWLESDCNIPSGESLVRQLMHGTRFIREEFGKECRYLWLPDAFGFCWALPQILVGCGIDTFLTTKISWNQYNHSP